MVLRPRRDLYEPHEGGAAGSGCVGVDRFVLTVMGVCARELRLLLPSPYIGSRNSAAVKSCASDTSDMAS